MMIEAPDDKINSTIEAPIIEEMLMELDIKINGLVEAVARIEAAMKLEKDKPKEIVEEAVKHRTTTHTKVGGAIWK